MEGITTPTGRLSGFYRQAATAFSEKNSHYFSSNNEQKIIEGKKNRGPLKEVIKVFNTDSHQICFGKHEKRKFKSIMAGTEYTDLYFYMTDVKTLATKLVKIDLPMQSFPNARVFYQYQSHTNEKVFFILNELYNDNKKNVCALVSFDYEGKLIDNIPFTMELEQEKIFNKYTNGGSENSILKGYRRDYAVYESTDGGAVKLMIAPNQNSFYVYGLFSTKDKKDEQVLGGFYIHKFDSKGNLLWKVQKDHRNDQDTQKNYVTGQTFKLIFLNNNSLGFWCKRFLSDVSVFYKINLENGEILENKPTTILGAVDFEFSRKKAFGGLKDSDLYIADGSDKIRMDMNTICAINFNADVKQYINGKVGVKFAAHLFENGIYLIEENSKENQYKLLKFDW
ncbi:hypothetical protein LZZ90_06420 [Flavobacterium sp. SM15]|uniref:hypothetical protein n=1 Tax=Flavobacterium sp. SM15 TaxID=2908005 RepID=UPI001EDADFB0|nr:hypothetical protein [Flavobacterium sp. SM15]MCG2611136.1 hypothetical protein [Flavobacterium sp. SM15]